VIRIKEIKESFLPLLFPHVCAGCGSDILNRDMQLCLRCLDRLRETHFELYANNPVEKIFWGRLQLEAATAQYYFSKGSMVQELMHQFKYKQNKELGLQLGRMMGEQLIESGRFFPDILLPLPLFPAKEKRRGYNQAEVLCQGMSESMGIPVLNQVIIRPHHTETQTRKGRVERWQNIEGKFILKDPSAIENKHVLLVDDVITTGATLESCGEELLKAKNLMLSVATLCIASKI
jgi:ComF family protein